MGELADQESYCDLETQGMNPGDHPTQDQEGKKRCHGEESCCDLETQGMNPGAFGRLPRRAKPQPMQQVDLHLSLAMPLPLRGMSPRSKRPLV